MKTFRRILVANRGEIAVRITKTAQRMGIEVVAIYASNDRASMHVKLADQAINLGEGSLSETYLNAARIVEIAKQNNCCAIHPGYGFLSENAEFAQLCIGNGLTFIGPSAYAIGLMGNKTKARQHILNLNIPTLVGYNGSKEELIANVENYDYPILLKAAAGGGGKGMHIIHSADELKLKVDQAAREAKSWFGNDALYIENYIEDARHIEVQILGDNHGNTIHLFERECSLQRRYQKVIEEAPSPSITSELREKLTGAAIEIAKSVNYSGVGTVEFLVSSNGNFYFLEMNTRIQVEHPVTEMITGIDLVEEQILVAQNIPLRFAQEDIKINGHAIEARFYAEDPLENYRPIAGKLTKVIWPKEIRVDTFFETPTEISADYDPMLAKLITFGRNRDEAIEKLHHGLTSTEIHGIKHNQQLLITLLELPYFSLNEINTAFLEEKHDRIKRAIVDRKRELLKVAIGGFIIKHFFPVKNEERLWQSLGTWRCLNQVEITDSDNELHNLTWRTNGKRIELQGDVLFKIETFSVNENCVSLLYNSVSKTISVTELESFSVVQIDGFSFNLKSNRILEHVTINRHKNNIEDISKLIASPLFGRVLEILISEGEKIEKGQTVAIIESMKMENKINAPSNGIIKKVFAKVGQKISENDLILEME